MKGKNSFLIINHMMSLVIGEKTYSLSDSHVHYNRIYKMLQAKKIRWDRIRKLLDVKTEIKNFFENNGVNIDVESKTVTDSSSGLDFSKMFEKVIETYKGDSGSIKLFLENLKSNPSEQSIQQVLDFLSANELPLTDDGCFYAYKYVRGDYKDCHTGTFDNSVGQIVKMDRNEVNPNKYDTCSTGLHFCSKDYLRSFHGEHLMCLKVNPRDVVCIPEDYNNSKGRCCQYQVVGEVTDATDREEKQIKKYDTVLRKKNSKYAKVEKLPVYKSVKDCLRSLKRDERKVGMEVLIRNDVQDATYVFDGGISNKSLKRKDGVFKNKKDTNESKDEQMLTFKSVKDCLKNLDKSKRFTGMIVRIKNYRYDDLYIFDGGIAYRNFKKRV